MESGDKKISAYRFEDRRQERIHKQLVLLGPGPAAFYVDACRVLASVPEFQTATNLIAHCLREIESGLRAVLTSLRDELPPVPTDCSSKKETHRDSIRAILAALEIPETHAVAEAWLQLPSGDDGLQAWTHRKSLAQPRPLDTEFRSLWDRMQVVLEFVLDRFEARYSIILRRLDELLTRSSPTKDDAQLLRQNIPDHFPTRAYFFDKLQNPAWLRLLQKQHFFDRPPELERDEATGTTFFRAWPECEYLARMASHDPGVVLEIALRIPYTQNIFVFAALVDLALGLPPNNAATWANRCGIEWLEREHQLQFVADRLGKLVIHLAGGNELARAFELAQAALSLLPDPRADQPSKGGEPYRFLEPQSRMDDYHYRKLIEQIAPVLDQHDRERTLRVLCSLLERALLLARGPGTAEELSDHTEIWRRAIEKHPHNLSFGLRHVLISAVRDATCAAGAAGPSCVADLVRLLESYRRNVFRRLALHLLRQQPSRAGALIAQRLTDLQLFLESEVRHEYVLLLQEHFGNLALTDQRTILGWIETGPAIEGEVFLTHPLTNQPFTTEELQEQADYWRLKRLTPLRDVLPPDWKARYESLAAKLGEIEQPEFATMFKSEWGPTSPKSSDDITQLTVDEIIEFARTWQAGTDFFAPSPEGFGRELSPAVAKDPFSFAEAAPRFAELDRTYVRALLHGLRDAAKTARAFPWQPVLQLCDWVVRQPRHADKREQQRDTDPDWGWTRKAIADLITAGCSQESGSAHIPIDLRSQVWAVLESLTDDSDPTPEHEAEFGGQNMDPSTLSINTVRGEAMHSVMRYALWVRRDLEEKKSATETFADMPEVGKVLEAHLDPVAEPSAAVRSVYGQWFPQLVLFDATWTKAHVEQIFPRDPERCHLRDAAWDAYVVYCDPYTNVVPLLDEQYMDAVARLADPVPQQRQFGNPRQELVAHLMRRYCWGALPLDDPSGLLARFYQVAPGELRGYAVESLGRVLQHSDHPPPSDALQRLQALWDWRLAAAKAAASPDPFTPELEAFGWWFASSVLPEAWAFAQLKAVLELIGKVDWDDGVMERLAALAPTTPEDSIVCARLMVEGATENWKIVGWRDHLEAIISAVVAGSVPSARQAAIDLVNRLAARGYPKFLKLLPDQGTKQQ